MRDRHDFIYLSPHLDDVVLSCGGQINRRAREGRSVLVYTLMAAEQIPPPPSPHAARFLEMCGLGRDAMRVRRREDERACARLGADWRHDDFLEAINRCDAEGRALYPTHESLFEQVREEDEELADKLTRRFGALPACEQVMAPLGVGGHVDHRLVRRAAEQVFGTRLLYYEDFPYANRWGAVSAVIRPRKQWRGEIVRLTSADFTARCEALQAYASQWPMLFGSRRALYWKNRLYIWRRGGERLWRKRV